MRAHTCEHTRPYIHTARPGVKPAACSLLRLNSQRGLVAGSSGGTPHVARPLLEWLKGNYHRYHSQCGFGGHGEIPYEWEGLDELFWAAGHSDIRAAFGGGLCSLLLSSGCCFSFLFIFPLRPTQGKLFHPSWPLEKFAWASASLGRPLGGCLDVLFFL